MSATKALVLRYLDDYDNLRDLNQSLSNSLFHDKCSLSIKIPESWDWVECVEAVAERATESDSVYIVYSNVEVYKVVSKMFTESFSVNYVSWQEIFWAIQTQTKDTRPLKDIRYKLSAAKYVVLVGASNMDADVIESIKLHTTSCLLLVN